MIPRAGHVLDDRAVLLRDRLQVVELVEHLGEAVGVDQDVERRRLPVLVDGDEPVAETLDRARVLAPEEREAL